MLFFSSKKFRKLFTGLLSTTALIGFQVQANPQTINEVAGVILTPQGQVIAKEIQRVFSDVPEMLYVANCESRGLVHREGGQLIVSSADGLGEGVFQVQMPVHRAEMKRMGLKPNILTDYFMYVRHLYDTSGLRPWASSKKCWQRYANTQIRR